MSATKELNHLLSAKVSFERLLSWRACTTRPASWLLPLQREWEKGVIHGHRKERMSQGTMYTLQAWEACSVSQNKHTKNMQRASDSTGFDTFTL